MKIVITGISKGIGSELCDLALAQGHEVIGVARREPNATLLQNPKFKFIHADIGNQNEVMEIGRHLRGHTSNVDLLINNAGVLVDSKAKFESTTAEMFEQTMRVNLIGVHLVTQQVLPLLEQSKSPKVITISSVMGSVADNSSGAYYAYRTSKAAVNAWNKSFSVDFPKITALVMHPGWVRTAMGGPQATLSVEDSAKGLLHFALESSIQHSGRFFDYSGAELPW